MLRRCCLLLLTCLCLSIPTQARADSLDTVLHLLWSAGMIDSAVIDAKPLVECLMQGNSTTTCSEQFAVEQAASSDLANDPKVALVVDVMQAANQGDWITVLEITGTDLLMQIACTAGIPGGGPVKDFICSSVFGEVAKKSKPVVKQVLIAVRSGDLDDWLKVVAMTGPSFACEIMPGAIPGKDVVCGTLGEILAGAAEAVGDAADAVYGSAAAFGEWVSGQSKHMPPEQYYNLHWKPWYHYGTMLQLQSFNGWHDLMKEIRDPCEDYFDSHTMSQDNAQETCDNMRARFSTEVGTFRKAIKLAPNAYLKAIAAPWSAAWAIEDHAGGDTTADHRNFIVNGCITDLRAKFPFPEPDPNRCQQIKAQIDPHGGPFSAILEVMYNKCVSDQNRQMPDPTVWEYLCKPVGDSFEKMFEIDRMLLEQQVMNLVMNRHCAFPAGWTGPGVELECSTSKGFDRCMDALQASHPEQRCQIEGKGLADEIIDKIGGNRCRHNIKEGQIECSRPWKWEKCETLLTDYRNQIPQLGDSLQCVYVDARFKPEVAKAEAILMALNYPPETEDPEQEEDSLQLTVQSAKPQLSATPAFTQVHLLNCSTSWDPLAISCNDSSVIFELQDRLPGASLPPCSPTPDPEQNGADAVCYSGAYPLPPQLGAPQTIPLPEDNKIILPGRSAESAPGKQLKTAPTMLAQAPALASTLTSTLPDYQIGRNVSIAGAQGSWGGILALDASRMQPGPAGTCMAEFRYTIENHGQVTSPAATTTTVSLPGRPPTSKSLGRISPNGSRQERVSLGLPAGTSMLTLTVDPKNRVEEFDETNNQERMTLRMNGACGTTQPSRMAPTPAKPSPVQPTAPAQGFNFSPTN